MERHEPTGAVVGPRAETGEGPAQLRSPQAGLDWRELGRRSR